MRSALVAFLVALTPAVFAAPVTVSGPPLPPPSAPDGEGGGLCVLAAPSKNPSADFSQSASLFSGTLNMFLDAETPAQRVHRVLKTPFDLSNNNATGGLLSYGDFTSTAPGTCGAGGCDLPFNDTTTAFGARMRGYLNLTPALAGKVLHFGFYGDDAFAFTVFDALAIPYPLVVRPPQLGSPTWRLTQAVKFEEPGLYPVEILYAQIAEHAALEISLHVGEFTDFERPANQLPVQSLSASGFALLGSAQLLLTPSGLPPFADGSRCLQCTRQNAGLPGNSGCEKGYSCDSAALCSPCGTDARCGATCAPCGGATPYCTGALGASRCVECRSDEQCPAPKVCGADARCVECRGDEQCAAGKVCGTDSRCGEPDPAIAGGGADAGLMTEGGDVSVKAGGCASAGSAPLLLAFLTALLLVGVRRPPASK